jgi:hypothetical protein
MAQRMGCRRFGSARTTESLPHRALERLIADVVSPLDSGARVDGAANPRETRTASTSHERRSRTWARDFRGRKDHWQPHRHFCAPDTIEQRELARQHFAEEKQQRALRLVLRRSGDVQLDSPVRKKRRDMRSRQIRWMAIAMEPDEAFDPVDVCLLGTKAVVLEPDAVADLVEQPRADDVRWHECLGGTNGQVRFDYRVRTATRRSALWPSDALSPVALRMPLACFRRSNYC